MTELPPDDDRTWYAVGPKPWTTYHIFQATHPRAAVAELRRTLTAEQLAAGKPLRDVQHQITAADLRVIAGPLSTWEAFQLELADAYGGALAGWRTTGDTIPVGAPIDPDATGRAAELAAEDAAAIRARVLARYLPPPEG